MDDLYFSTNLDNQVTLCISPLTDARAMAAGLVGDCQGYFLYERDHSVGPHVVAVIAQLHSEEAALKLSRMLGME